MPYLDSIRVASRLEADRRQALQFLKCILWIIYKFEISVVFDVNVALRIVYLYNALFES